jgi:hypothetical protein
MRCPPAFFLCKTPIAGWGILKRLNITTMDSSFGNSEGSNLFGYRAVSVSLEFPV